MKLKTKKASMMIEVMTYIIFSFLIVTLFLRFYLGMMKDYDKALDFFMETDYAYQTFETLKVDLYTHRDQFVLVDDVLHIRKSSYINGNLMQLRQKDDRLIYQYGTKVMDLCRGLKDVQMRQVGEILWIKLIFAEVTYERAFHLAE